MSYSAITSIGVHPNCPKCGKEIKHDQHVVTCLYTKSFVVEHYNKELEADPNEVTVDMNWHQDVTFHEVCFTGIMTKEVMKPIPSEHLFNPDDATRNT